MDQYSFRTSSYSQKTNCVEVADLPGVTAVRDTQNRDGPHLEFHSEEWAAFIEAVRAGLL